MIEKSRSASFVLATIAILGQPPRQLIWLLAKFIFLKCSRHGSFTFVRYGSNSSVNTDKWRAP